MNRVGLVVSRYYENLKWVEDLKAPLDVYIYNRQGESPNMGVPNAVAWAQPKDHSDELGGLDVQRCKANGINLQVINIPDDPGFETSTYAHHMYSCYDSLNEFTVFVQAHPLIYVKNALTILNDPDKLIYTKYRKESYQLVPYTAENLIDFEPFCDMHGTLRPTEDYGWAPYKDDFTKVPWLKFCKGMPNRTNSSGEWSPIDVWDFGAGNQFIVSKELIHRHEPSYYKELQDFTNTYMDPNGDARPHWQQLNQGPNIMEGIWQFIF